MRFAVLEARLVLVNVVKNFNLHPLGERASLTLDPKYVTNFPKEGWHVKVEKR